MRIPLVVKISFVVLGTVTAACFLAPWLVPEGPLRGDVGSRLIPPAWTADGSMEYLLGTDHLGRDMVARLLYGGRITLVVGISAVLVAGVIGVIVGLVGGYMGGWIDTSVMRIVDIQLTIPFLALALLVTTIIGPGLRNVILILGVAGWLLYARVVRAAVLTIRELEFVDAARVLGSSRMRVMFVNILPNVLPTVLVMATLAVSQMIIVESSLSFLGMGLPPRTATWGTMLSDARDYMVQAWWITALPGLAITATVLSVNLIGDWLRDRFDPHLQ